MYSSIHIYLQNTVFKDFLIRMNFIASTLFSIYKTPDNNQENKYNVYQNVYEFNSNKLVIKNENQIKNAKNVFF